MSYIKIVVVKPEGIKAMAVAAHHDHTGALGGQNLLDDEVGKQKWAEMVSRQLGFKAIVSDLVLRSHDPRIVDQHVNDGDIIPGVDLIRRLADIFE